MKYYEKCTILCLVSVLFLGCRPERSDAPQQRVRLRHDQLVNEYLRGDVSQARNALEQAIRYVQGETALTPLGHDDLIGFDYYRLYVLDKRIGDESAANDCLAKARHWAIEAMRSMGMSSSEIRQNVKEYNAAKILEAVNKHDRDLNDGNLPRYVDYLKKGIKGQEIQVTGKQL